MPRPAMLAMMAQAKLRLIRAKNVWSVVTGPAASVAATCARVNWTVVDALLLRTDTGVELNLTVDPPAVIEVQVRRAVERWR